MKRELIDVKNASELPIFKESSNTDDYGVAAADDEDEIQELISDPDLGLTLDDEIQNLEKEVFGGVGEPEQKTVSK